jgi:hypothetical protein
LLERVKLITLTPPKVQRCKNLLIYGSVKRDFEGHFCKERVLIFCLIGRGSEGDEGGVFIRVPKNKNPFCSSME